MKLNKTIRSYCDNKIIRGRAGEKVRIIFQDSDGVVGVESLDTGNKFTTRIEFIVEDPVLETIEDVISYQKINNPRKKSLPDNPNQISMF